MGIKTVINSEGQKTLTWVETPANVLWRERWQHAWNAMPRHSATMLCKLLGYKVTKPPRLINKSGKAYYMSNGSNSRIYVNYTRGSKPRNPQAARLLTMLAGPHGETVAKAIAIQRGIPFK